MPDDRRTDHELLRDLTVQQIKTNVLLREILNALQHLVAAARPGPVGN